MNLLLLLVGFFVAWIGTIAGFGGGVLAVPAMVIGLGLPAEMAIGAVAVSMVPSTLWASIRNWRSNNIDFKVWLWFEPPTVVGTVIGAQLSSYVSTALLLLVFGSLLVYTGFRGLKLWGAKTQSPQPKWILLGPKVRTDNAVFGWIPLGGVGVCAGVLAGLTGIGGGVIKTPIMHKALKMPVRVATSTALAMVALTALVSAGSHFKLGHVQWEPTLWSTAGFWLGAEVGIRTAGRLKEDHIVRVVNLVLVLVGILLFAKALWI